ncbi:unnamed protein product [Vitrella brassicaformis CCMP3155]|uniref:Coiled-coil domain-containing protein 61 n=2 Tax=Vitrella brassicaformis TaxID=1169539 RepID=A0A0G4FQP6_VITBC|nr:unnamed protein product [Vitrella brassicaformis CCMP3155]|eukprot:CEM16396.1 unnamed protein product [Vitrella brassicaformis CCMP3155]
MASLPFSHTVERRFHDSDYSCTLEGDDNGMVVDILQRGTGMRWRAKFSRQLIEEITQRTGNFKSYEVFRRMLFSALSEDCESVYLDLLTPRDLALLRGRAEPHHKAGSRRLHDSSSSASSSSGGAAIYTAGLPPPGGLPHPHPPTPTPSSASQPSVHPASDRSKRYLILTYQGEFDRVHYPLALAYQEDTEVAALQATVARLRGELSAASRRIERLTQQQGTGAAEVTDDALMRENDELRRKLAAKEREVVAMRRDIQAVSDATISTSQSQAMNRRSSETASDGGRDHTRQQLHKLTEELHRCQALRQQDQRTLQTLQRDLQRAREGEKKLKAQVKRLEDDNNTIRLRLRHAPSRDPSPSRWSTRQPAGRAAGGSAPPSRRPTSRASSVASRGSRGPSPSPPPRRPHPGLTRQRAPSPPVGSRPTKPFSAPDYSRSVVKAPAVGRASPTLRAGGVTVTGWPGEHTRQRGANRLRRSFDSDQSSSSQRHPSPSYYGVGGRGGRGLRGRAPSPTHAAIGARLPSLHQHPLPPPKQGARLSPSLSPLMRKPRGPPQHHLSRPQRQQHQRGPTSPVASSSPSPSPYSVPMSVCIPSPPLQPLHPPAKLLPPPRIPVTAGKTDQGPREDGGTSHGINGIADNTSESPRLSLPPGSPDGASSSVMPATVTGGSRPHGKAVGGVEEESVGSGSASPEIAVSDIDARLHALQNFLRSAKAGGYAK